jgi:superfamily I DNA/RNA helicase
LEKILAPPFFKKVGGLNPEQQQAATHDEGPALIIAGPGTGKTRVLAVRFAYLVVEKGIAPENILAVTFTNRAAAEMRERVKGLLQEEKPAVINATTFHALGLAILKELLAADNKITTNSLTETIGREKNFFLIDEDDRKRLLHRIPGCEKRQVNRFSDAISKAKQGIKSFASIEDPELASIFKQYETLLKEMNCFDLDDLIYIPVRLFELYPEVAEYYRNKYRWIMVDEYQDINYAQYRMISSLASNKNANLCVIGDPDQAIYGFRGADVTFIEKFRDDFPEAVLYRLKKSYRCSDSILRASRDVINKTDFEAGALRGMGKGVKIRISKNHSHKSEAEFAARTIEDMMGGLRFFSMDSSISQGNKAAEIESLSDFALLCRTKGQFEAIEKAFKDHAIPYQTIGEQPFFKQEPVHRIIDMLRLLQNPANKFLKEKLFASGGQGGREHGEAFTASRRQKHIKETIALIIDNYFAAEKKEHELAIMQLMELAGNFGKDLDGFLKFTVLGTGMDAYRPDLENVTLMTLHAAKGLEFRCVFIVGCEDGLLPYSLYESQTCDADEERRLLYVGMTRAKEFLFLCHAEKRFVRGREFHLKRSPFLDPIEKELIELSQMKKRKPKEKEYTQPTLFGKDEL